jgi:hypothetical protein
MHAPILDLKPWVGRGKIKLFLLGVASCCLTEDQSRTTRAWGHVDAAKDQGIFQGGKMDLSWKKFILEENGGLLGTPRPCTTNKIKEMVLRIYKVLHIEVSGVLSSHGNVNNQLSLSILLPLIWHRSISDVESVKLITKLIYLLNLNHKFQIRRPE